MFYLECELTGCHRPISSNIRVEEDEYSVCDLHSIQISELRHIGCNDENSIRKGVMFS